MLTIKTEYQELASVSVIVKFHLTANGHDVSGTYTSNQSEHYHLCDEDVQFDDLESGKFTPEQIDELVEYVESNIKLPIIINQ